MSNFSEETAESGQNIEVRLTSVLHQKDNVRKQMMNLNVVASFRLKYSGVLPASGYHLCWAPRAWVVQVLELSFRRIIEYFLSSVVQFLLRGHVFIALTLSSSFITVSSTQGRSWSRSRSGWSSPNVWKLEGHLLKVKYKVLFGIFSKSTFICRKNNPPTYHVKCGIKGRIEITLSFKGD